MHEVFLFIFYFFYYYFIIIIIIIILYQGFFFVLLIGRTSGWRVGLRAKKWYWVIFTWLIDATLNNAWHLYKKSGRKMTKLEFKREIVLTYLTRYKTPKSTAGARGSAKLSSRVVHDIRYDRMDHFLVETNGKKRRRCAYPPCTAAPVTMCVKCDVGLCAKCNVQFHTEGWTLEHSGFTKAILFKNFAFFFSQCQEVVQI